MGTDFNIKGVSAATAAALPQPSSEAPKDAVATDLPASQSVSAANAAARMRNDSQPSPDSTSHQTVIDRSSNSIVYQVVDNRTSLVVRQFPDEAMLRRRAYFHTLDMMKNNPVREPAADLLA